MARILAYGPLLVNQPDGYADHVIRHLGGEPQLLEWLSRFPGEPAFLAATARLADVLSILSSNDPVVDAIRELRSRHRSPSALSPYLLPDTDHETLSDLAEVLLMRVRTEHWRASLQLSYAALDLVDSAIQLAESRGTDVAQGRSYATDARRALNAAAA
jgi:hypothetical protein